jgi:hypothetical protein
MTFIQQTSLALACCALLISGCSASPASNQPTPGLDVTGNWQFAPANNATQADTIGSLAGSLVSQGSSVTAVLHGSGCVAPTQDITFSGTDDEKGNLTLTSTNLANNVATITGTVSITPGGMLIDSSLVITGSGACAMSSYPNFNGTAYSPLDGKFNANLTSADGATATLMADLTAGTTNADGQVPETGTLAIVNSACSSTYSFTGFALGGSLQGTLATGSGPASGVTFAGQLSHLEPGAGVALTNPNGSCAAGSFTGTLIAQ